MRRTISVASATAFLLAGCAEGPPPAQAPAAPPRQGAVVWQQFCEQAWNVPHASALAAARGADGWELVAMYNGVLCYKRPAHPAVRADEARASPEAPHVGPASAGPVPIVRDPGF